MKWKVLRCLKFAQDLFATATGTTGSTSGTGELFDAIFATHVDRQKLKNSSKAADLMEK